MSVLINLFTSFSGHRPAQRECARTGLRSHARCHPYPIPQPVKVGHTTGVYDPYSFRIVMWVLLRPMKNKPVKVPCCETGPTVFRPYPRRLESLTICKVITKGGLSPQLFKDPECWSGRDLNPRTPLGRPTLSQPSQPGGSFARGALGYFLGGYVPPGTQNWHPVLKKISPKLTPRSTNGRIFYSPF